MSVDQTLDLQRNGISGILLHITTILFIIILLAVTFQVVVRELQIPGLAGIVWTEPLSRVLLIICTFLGAAAVSMNRQHIAIEIVPDRLASSSPLAYEILKIITNILVLIFLSAAFLGVYSNMSRSWDISFGGTGFVTEGQMFFSIGLGLGLLILTHGYFVVKGLVNVFNTVQEAHE